MFVGVLEPAAISLLLVTLHSNSSYSDRNTMGQPAFSSVRSDSLLLSSFLCLRVLHALTSLSLLSYFESFTSYFSFSPEHVVMSAGLLLSSEVIIVDLLDHISTVACHIKGLQKVKVQKQI